MAISGMHISLVAGSFYWIVSFLWRRVARFCLWIPAQQVGAGAGLFAAIIYAAMAGFSIPTQRALLMVSVVLINKLLRKPLALWHSLIVALFLIVLINPLAVLSTGFYLSFSAVFIILYAVSGRLNKSGLWWKFARVHGVMTIGLIPVSLALFQQTSLFALFANVLAIPWVSFFVLPFALCGSLFALMTPAWAYYLLRIADSSLSLLWLVLEFLTRYAHFFIWHHAILDPWILAATVMAVLLVLAPRAWPARSLAVCYCLPLLFLPAAKPVQGEAWFTLLDVGQGLAAVVRTQQHTLVFDTGPKFSRDFDAGKAVLLPFLRSRAVSYVDTLVVSHSDNDHIGGARSLLEAMPLGTIMSSEPKWFQPREANLCTAGTHWQWDGVDFEFLYPLPDNYGFNNDSSCVLKVTTGSHSVLLTGDIEKYAEASLLKHAKIALKADILVAPHHGSRTSSSEAFVQAVHPRYVHKFASLG